MELKICYHFQTSNRVHYQMFKHQIEISDGQVNVYYVHQVNEVHTIMNNLYQNKA